MHATQCLRPSRKSTRWVGMLTLVTLATARALGQGAEAPELAFAYANDTYDGTDRYFTAGLVESYGTDRARLTLTQSGYTPSEIADAEMRPGDRPYAAVAYATATFALPTDAVAPRWFLSGTLGVIGPMVRGEQVQGAVHRLVAVQQPMGWRYQVANDLLVGAELRYRRSVVRTAWGEITATAAAEAGTLRTRLGVESTMSLGPRAFRLWLRPQGWAPVYDATLQGGAFNRDNPVTVGADRVVRLVGALEYGVEARYGRLAGTLSRTVLTREFVGGMPHAWTTGGIRFRVSN